MAVTEQTPSNSSTGNGVTTVFPYTFKILAAADLEVTVDGAVKTLNTDYTVSGAGDDAGGNVTFTTAPANLTTVVRRRSMAYTRSTDYQYQGDLPNDVLNADQDAPILMIQQLAEEVGRSLKAPAGEGAMDVLPAASDRANLYLVFDANGNPSTSQGTGADAGLRADLAAASGPGLVGFSQSESYAAGTLGAKLRTFVSVKDAPYSATGDGVTDDTAAMQAAINANRNGEIVWFPDGTYLTSGITVYSDCHLAFAPGAVLKMSANGVCVKTRNSTSQTYVTNVVSRVRIDNLEIDMDSKLGFGLLLEGATHAHIEKPRVYNVGNGTFSYNDGVANDTYNSAGIVLKGVHGVQGCYYNRVQRAQVVGTSTSLGSNGIYLGTTASGDNQRANFNAIIQPVCSTLENGVSINMGGDNYVEMPEVSACATGVRVGRTSGTTASRRNHIKMPYVELCTTGLLLTSNAADTVIDGIGSTSGTATPISDSGTKTAFFAANSSTYTSGFARFYQREIRDVASIEMRDGSGNAETFNVDTTTFSAISRGLTSAGVGTYNGQNGRARKHGTTCDFHFVCDWSAHTGTGTLELAGLPFAAAGGTTCPVTVYVASGLTLSGGAQVVQGYIASGGTSITLTQYAGGSAGAISIPSAAVIRVSGSYEVAA